MLGLQPQSRQFVVEISALGAISFRFLERPSQVSRTQHPLIAQRVLSSYKEQIWTAMPRRQGLHNRVGGGAGTPEHDCHDATVPITGDEPTSAVPLLPVVVRPRLQRRLVRK